jgi:MFS family permease
VARDAGSYGTGAVASAGEQAQDARPVHLAVAFGLYTAAAATPLFPALVNGFPLVMGDTWRYVREAGGEYSWASSHFYGYLLRLFAGSSLWLVVLLQAAVALYVLSAFFRRVLGATHGAAAAAAALLALTSSVSLFTSLVMTDLMLGLGLVAAATVLLAPGSRRSDLVLLLVLAFATAAHPVAFALFAVLVLAGLLVVAAARARTGRWRGVSRVGLVAGAVAAGAVALTISNAIVWGKPTPNPHSAVATFAYLYLHGDLERQLEDCERWDVCALPKTPPRPDRPELFDFGSEGLDAFNWFLFDDDESVLWRELGGPAEFAGTARAIVVAHVTAEPGSYARRVASSASEQLFQVRALSHLEWMTQYLGERHSDLLQEHGSRDPPRFERSRQFRKTLDLRWASDVGVIFALGGAVATAGAGTLLLGRRVSRRPKPASPLDRALLASLLLLAFYIAHAFVVATSTYPTPRYGGRVAWLLVLALWALAYGAAAAYGRSGVFGSRGSRVHEDDVPEPSDGDAEVPQVRGPSGGPRERG